MRLIDADKLKKDMLLQNILGESMQKIIDRYIHIVDSQPTAFDVEKVVKQLDKASDYYEFDEQGKEHVQMLNLIEALEIVKGGGVE